MRWMPPPWEGAHPAFPEPTDDPYKLARDHPVQPIAAPLGLAIATSLRLGHLLSGRQWRAGTTLASLGVATLGISLLRASQESETRKAAQALLDKEGISMPYPTFFKSTEKFSLDDAGLVGLLVGGIAAALRKPAQLGSLASSFRVLGGGAVGGYVSTVAYALSVDRDKALAAKKASEQRQAVGATIYRSIMKTDPPATLYLDAANAVHGRGFTVNGEDASPYLADEGAISHILSRTVERARQSAARPSAQDSSQVGTSQKVTDILRSGLEAVGMAEVPDGNVLVEQESGTFAFQAFKHFDGSITYAPQRDFRWQPATPAEGIKALEDFIAVQEELRALGVQSTEYTWRLLALWEARFATTLKEPDSPTKHHRVTCGLKICELLSSTHQVMYEQIGDTDWLISQARKIILQLQNDGTWLPASKPASFDYKTYKPSPLLMSIQGHRANLEARGREEERENWAATKTIEAEVEQQVRSPGSPETGATEDFEI